MLNGLLKPECRSVSCNPPVVGVGFRAGAPTFRFCVSLASLQSNFNSPVSCVTLSILCWARLCVTVIPRCLQTLQLPTKRILQTLCREKGKEKEEEQREWNWNGNQCWIGFACTLLAGKQRGWKSGGEGDMGETGKMKQGGSQSYRQHRMEPINKHLLWDS